MKTHCCLVAAFLLCGTLLTMPATQGTGSAHEAKPSRKSTPGVEAAQVLSTITGVAISPLLGVSAVGAWKYFKTPSEKRTRLPWYAQPWFWAPALLIVVIVFVKDALGTTVPTAVKKPFDVLEVFENKISALIATGAFVPLVASFLRSSSGDDSAMLAGLGFAFIDLTPLWNILIVPLAMLVFMIVFMVSHVINVLILISPFGTVDAALKSARLLLLSTVTFSSFANPYVGAAWALVIIVLSYFLAGWSFRMSVFGTVFAWDLLTFRHTRFKPAPTANWMFTARKIDDVPVRTYGKLSRDENSQLVLRYRPWLLWPARTLHLPAGRYAIGRGLLYPELMQLEGEKTRTMLELPPRYRTHEEELAAIYGISDVQDVGMIKGIKAAWRWLKRFVGFGTKIAAPAAVPASLSS